MDTGDQSTNALLADILKTVGRLETASALQVQHNEFTERRLSRVEKTSQTVVRWGGAIVVLAALVGLFGPAIVKAALDGDGDSFNEEFVGEFDGYHYEDGEAKR